MNPPFLQTNRPARARAFTLVEITLALGIVAFAMLVTLGMNSTAVQSFGDTRRATVYANIVQYVDAQANLTPFNTIDDESSDMSKTLNMQKKSWLFDAEGLYLGSRDTTSSSAAPASPTPTSRPAVYTAQLLVINAATADNIDNKLMYLPGQTAVSPATKNIKITITDSGTTTSNPAVFHIVVGNLGK